MRPGGPRTSRRASAAWETPAGGSQSLLGSYEYDYQKRRVRKTVGGQPLDYTAAHALLKPGGELYFSDVYADRRVPAALKQDPVMFGECLAGARRAAAQRRAGHFGRDKQQRIICRRHHG